MLHIIYAFLLTCGFDRWESALIFLVNILRIQIFWDIWLMRKNLHKLKSLLFIKKS